MALARGHEPKTDLTPDERVRVAYFHLCRGWAQQDLADFCGVNSGRVNEAVMRVRDAVEWPERRLDAVETYKLGVGT